MMKAICATHAAGDGRWIKFSVSDLQVDWQSLN